MVSGTPVPEEARVRPATRRRKTSPRRFYSQALSAAERAELPAALQVEGMDEEIALLRLRLRQAIEQRPEDLELMFRGVDLIAKTVAARYRLSKTAQGDLSDQLAKAVHLLADLLPGGLVDE